MPKLYDIVSLCFKLGLTAFGGPAAHIAMLHNEVVTKREWMTDEHFLDLVGATSLIPGPNSTEMVMHCGHEKAGPLGLISAGLAFILPACILTALLAYCYTLAFQIPNIDEYLIGLKAVVIILIVQAIQKLWKKAIKSFELALVSLTVLTLTFFGLNDVLSLFTGALLGLFFIKARNNSKLHSFSLSLLFFYFFKIGSILFGSGYVLIGYLQSEFVEKLQWLTAKQLADAIAFGQFTPGPVLSTATFIGYLLGKTPGAILATIGIFLPSFLFVSLLNPIIPKLRGSINFRIFLDCVNAGAIGLMGYALLPLSKITFLNPIALITLLFTSLLLWRWKSISTMKLVGSGFIFSIILTQLKFYFN